MKVWIGGGVPKPLMVETLVPKSLLYDNIFTKISLFSKILAEVTNIAIVKKQWNSNDYHYKKSIDHVDDNICILSVIAIVY